MPTETCEPPEEHRGHEWHWLRFELQDPQPVQWCRRSERWWRAGMWFEPWDMAASGWRYVAPCPLPAITPREWEGG